MVRIRSTAEMLDEQIRDLAYLISQARKMSFSCK